MVAWVARVTVTYGILRMTLAHGPLATPSQPWHDHSTEHPPQLQLCAIILIKYVPGCNATT